MVGRTLARYQIVEQIGAGGMGVVYRARDTQLERFVALKVVGKQDQVEEKARERLRREARTASALNHPNICTIYEAGEADGETYIAMELVEGRSLSALIGSDGLPVETAIRHGAQIADALAHAHERGVVHRDLKSANVIVTPEGRSKVLDFGLARRGVGGEGSADETLTQQGAVVGTLTYMAPEVLRGEAADARSDLWALGVMLYQAVTGRLPFRGTTAFETTSAILRDSAAPLPPHVPPGLAAIIQRLLAKQAGERYQRAGEVRAALEAIQPSAVAASASEPAAGASRRPWSGPPGPPSELRLSDGSRPSENAEANEYYERGLLFAGGGPRHDPAQWNRMLERALALDPKFAAARGQLAFTHMLVVLQGDSNDPGWLYKAEEEARQALQDDIACAVAHSALAGTYLNLGRKELVPGEAEQALQSNLHDPAVHLWFPMYHRTNGDYEQAIQHAQQIVTRWPLFWPTRWALGDLIREQGDVPGAIRALERILEQDPGSRVALWGLAHAYMDAGDLPKARQALERVDAQHRQNYRSRLTWALLLALERTSAEALREMDDQVEAYTGISYPGPLPVAEVHAVLGDTAKALEWMDRAARWGDEREDWFRRDPMLANIRDHPRFQQMLESVAYRRKQRAR